MSKGLVLNGGGGKGAYQIGVWKYLRERNIKFDYISGTSAGALNACLIALNDLEGAAKLWTELQPGKVRKLDAKQILRIVQSLGKELIDLIALKKSRKTFKLAREAFRVFGFALKFKDVLALVMQQGIFSTEPLRKLINNHVNFESFPRNPVVFTAVVRNHPLFIFGDKQYINFTSSHNSIKEKLLLASSAVPLIFPTTNIGNVTYTDGGLPIVGDNSPVVPLYFRGCTTMYVVHTRKNGGTDRKKYSRAKIIDVSPKTDLGSFLKFEGEFSKRLIELGYDDARYIIT